jgi:hypothetical protein
MGLGGILKVGLPALVLTTLLSGDVTAARSPGVSDAASGGSPVPKGKVAVHVKNHYGYRGVRGVQVYLTDCLGRTDSTTSDSSGLALFRAVRTGTAVVWVERGAGKDRDTVVVRSGRTIRDTLETRPRDHPIRLWK